MKFLVAASLLVSASAFSVAPNTQGASSTVSSLRIVGPLKFSRFVAVPVGLSYIFEMLTSVRDLEGLLGLVARAAARIVFIFPKFTHTPYSIARHTHQSCAADLRTSPVPPIDGLLW